MAEEKFVQLSADSGDVLQLRITAECPRPWNIDIHDRPYSAGSRRENHYSVSKEDRLID